MDMGVFGNRELTPIYGSCLFTNAVPITGGWAMGYPIFRPIAVAMGTAKGSPSYHIT